MDGARVRLRFLGGPGVEVEGRTLTLHNRRALALLAYVIVEAGRHSRSSLATMLWEDTEPATARGNLRVLLSDIRTRLPDVMDIGREHVEWIGGGDVVVDVVELRSVADVLDDPATSRPDQIERCRQAVELYRGELLPGYEDLGMYQLTRWLETERELLRHTAVAISTRLVDLLMLEKRPDEAVGTAAHLVALDEYRERSHLALMRALLDDGRPHDALRQFERAGEKIETELGLPLGPEITAFADSLRVRTATSARQGTRPVVPRFAPLPAVRPLLGRDELVDELVATRRGSERGVVTLVGPSGVGKTSIALTAAHRWRADGADVVFVDLSSIDEPDRVGGAIAGAFGTADDEREDGVEAAAGMIGDREVHLVIDNMEHVLAAGGTVARLVDTCPEVIALVTSRLPLRLDGERIVPVPPLETPAEGLPAHQATDSASVQLFLEAARRSGAPRRDSSEELDAVVRVCRALDGLPLAIELVAARRRIMDAAALAGTLEEGLRTGDLSLAAGGPLDAPERHRGLRAAVVSSIELLGHEARDLLLAASVFDGPFALEHLGAVGAPDASPTDLLAAAEMLVDLLLLRRTDDGNGSWCSVLPYVRAVATEQLEASGDRADVVARLIEHDRRLVEQAAAGFKSPDAGRWFAHIDRYWPTLRSTLDCLHAAGDPAHPAMVVALGPFWMNGGRFAEGARLATRCAVPQAWDDESLGTPWLRSELRLWSAALRAEAVGYAASAGVVDEALSALTELRDTDPPPAVELRALDLAQHVMDLSSRPDLARPLVFEGLALAERSGMPWFAVEFAYGEAMLVHLDEDDDRAAELFPKVVADAELHGNRKIQMYAQMMCDLSGVAGGPGGTPASLAEQLDHAIEAGDRRQVIWLTASLGAVRILDAELEEAAGLYLDALALSRDADYFLGIGFSLMGGAAIAGFRGDLANALEFHGALEEHLEFLARSMPRGYSDPYVALAASFDDAERADPSLAEARHIGRTRDSATTLIRLAKYLEHVRSSARSASLAS